MSTVELECQDGVHARFVQLNHRHGDACCRAVGCEPTLIVEESLILVLGALLLVLSILATATILEIIGQALR